MEGSHQKKIIILTAPSGAGKTSVKSRLLDALKKELSFSVSATTRKIRGNEQEGIDYHYTNEEVFKKLIENNSFIEWEMVYPGLYYGTTVQEINSIWEEGKVPVLDIDVKGALNVKKQFGEKVLTIFIEPPSIEVLKERLQKRGTDTAENILIRINKATEEMQYKGKFDQVVLNDDIERAAAEVIALVRQFIKN
ncbi:MAG: guanylate kinase [Chitinophagia bacterium]|nr:guanylate kinase [Chitinophagia bacterium]